MFLMKTGILFTINMTYGEYRGIFYKCWLLCSIQYPKTCVPTCLIVDYCWKSHSKLHFTFDGLHSYKLIDVCTLNSHCQTLFQQTGDQGWSEFLQYYKKRNYFFFVLKFEQNFLKELNSILTLILSDQVLRGKLNEFFLFCTLALL